MKVDRLRHGVRMQGKCINDNLVTCRMAGTARQDWVCSHSYSRLILPRTGDVFAGQIWKVLPGSALMTFNGLEQLQTDWNRIDVFEGVDFDT